MLARARLQGNPLICDCRMKWLSEWIAYNAAKNAKHWLDVREALVWSRCVDRPGGVDNLLSMYDASASEYAAFHKREQEQRERHTKPNSIASVSPPLDCTRKISTGFAAFFSSASSRISALNNSFCAHLFLLPLLIVFANF